MNEIWKDVPGYEGYYQASNLGRIKSLVNRNGCGNITNRELILKPGRRREYLTVVFCVKRVKKTYLVHRIILSTFNQDRDKPQVNHINGIKADNRLGNLEWCTQSENMKHAYRIGLEKPVDNGLKKGVAILRDGTVIEKYSSIRDMCRMKGLDRRSVQRVMQGKKSHHKNYTFQES